jgi:hypothetical protein
VTLHLNNKHMHTLERDKDNRMVIWFPSFIIVSKAKGVPNGDQIASLGQILLVENETEHGASERAIAYLAHFSKSSLLK